MKAWMDDDDQGLTVGEALQLSDWMMEEEAEVPEAFFE